MVASERKRNSVETVVSLVENCFATVSVADRDYEEVKDSKPVDKVSA